MHFKVFNAFIFLYYLHIPFHIYSIYIKKYVLIIFIISHYFTLLSVLLVRAEDLGLMVIETD